MPLGEKLFTEEGDVEEVKGIDSLREPKERTSRSRVTGIDGKFPSGDDEGKGTMNLRDGKKVDGSYTGSIATAEGIFKWQSIEMSKVVDGEKKVKGVEILIGFSQSQKWARLNNIIIVLETEMDLSSGKFFNTAYEWLSTV